MNPFLATDGYKTGHHKMYPKGTSIVYSNFTPRSNKHAPNGADGKPITHVVSFGQQMVMQQIKEMFDKDFFGGEYRKSRERILSKKSEGWDRCSSQLKQLKQQSCDEIKKEYSLYLGTDYDVSHIEDLWDLGYLPIKVKALPEGTLVPMNVPVLTVYNTKPEFYWLTNFLETLISNLLWKPMTSATIAHEYKKLLIDAAKKTDEKNVGFVEFQGHDFSMRGLDSLDATISSGLGHATSFMGSDSLPVIHGSRKYYGEKEFVVGSVNATEHSVMCAGSKDDELGTFRYLMEQFPTGILSIVSDTWNLWDVLTKYLPELKDEILKRDGKIVIRPDSGDPVDIICGKLSKKPKPLKFFNYLQECKDTGEFKEELSLSENIESYIEDDSDEAWRAICKKRIDSHIKDGGESGIAVFKLDDKLYQCKVTFSAEWIPDWSVRANIASSPKVTELEEIKFSDKTVEEKGVIELLWDLFGGTINKQGYKVLDPHIGAIYGDSITLDRAKQICERLEAKGFASTNIVLGVGSFTYQFNTRDTFGFAMKATYVEIVNQKALAQDEHLSVEEATEGREIFKDPVTDDGTKKSAKGLLAVDRVSKTFNSEYYLQDQVSWEKESKGELQTIFEDGTFQNETTLTQIRQKLNDKI